ncbi:MAG: hypothetical protein WBZ14_10435 [Terriglobales bacterium]|jgi:hypothetical protein
MAYEELFTDLLKAEREEDVTDALTVFGLEKFFDSNWLPYGGIENNFGIIGAEQVDSIVADGGFDVCDGDRRAFVMNREWSPRPSGAWTDWIRVKARFEPM